MNTQKKGMTGKDIITVGIFSAIYFVINFAFMLLSGLHPLLWILMPGLIAVFAGIPFLMMCTKVPKTGAVVLMGFITALIYFVTGQFTVVILIAFAVSCILAELCRICSHYRSFRGNALAYVFFAGDDRLPAACLDHAGQFSGADQPAGNAGSLCLHLGGIDFPGYDRGSGGGAYRGSYSGYPAGQRNVPQAL